VVLSEIQWDRRERPLAAVSAGEWPLRALCGGSRIRTWEAFATDLQAAPEISRRSPCDLVFLPLLSCQGPCVPAMFPCPEPLSQGIANALVVAAVVTVNAVGVYLQQDGDAVAETARHLSRRDPRSARVWRPRAGGRMPDVRAATEPGRA
jgi:hypothetical protein